MAGSVIQAIGTVEFEDGLWIGNHLKGSKWPVEGLHYTLGSTRGSAHTQVPLGADWIPIYLSLRGWYNALFLTHFGNLKLKSYLYQEYWGSYQSPAHYVKNGYNTKSKNFFDYVIVLKNDTSIICASFKKYALCKLRRAWLKKCACHTHFNFKI